MFITYAMAVKTARMTATRDHFANGSIDIMAANDTVLATFGLSASGGTISNDTWTLAVDAATVQGEDEAGAGTVATKADIKTSGGAANIPGLTVGPASTAWQGSSAVVLGQVQSNGGNLYEVVTAGTTASSGGPTGTGTGITDGTAVWDYLMAVPAIALSNTSIAAGQDVTFTSGAIQHAADPA